VDVADLVRPDVERAPTVSALPTVSGSPGFGARLRRFAGRPLVHFVLFGALLLVTRHQLAGGELASADAAPRRDPVVISRERARELAAEFQRRGNGAPSEAQRRALVEQAVDEEVLLREARVLGLALGDRSIRRRLVEKMRLVGDRPGRREEALVRDAHALGLDDDVVIRRLLVEKMRIELRRGAADAAITDADLAAYLERHRAELEQPARLTFTQLFLAADSRGPHLDADARRMLTRLRSDASTDAVAALSDPFPLGAQLRAYTHAQLLGRFGKPFAEAVAHLAPGAWSGPIASPFGMHLVRVDEHVPARLPAIDEVRPALTRAVAREQAQHRLARGIARLRELYEVRIEADEARAAALPGADHAS
jgi:hypothetical protein